jgi:hypothetical protein
MAASTGRYNLARLPGVNALLRSRWPQFSLTVVALAGFVFAIVAGWAGTPVGSHNFAIVFVWIAWWAGLLLVAVPVLGRGWCSICPIPAPGEWLQRGALLGPASGPALGLGWRWPRQLRNIWLQNGAFAVLALFSAVVLTQPRATALVMAGLLLLAVATSLVFERRAFCRYLCPVGGFIGLYSQLAPVELRVRDSRVCATHTEKTCYTGSAEGYGCPWQVFPGGLVKNTYCGLCLECLRTCPHDNVVVNLREFGADLGLPTGRRLDESFKAFLMLGSAAVYSSVMLGPWGALKTAAYGVGSLPWLAYAVGFLLLVFGLLPGSFWLAIQAGRLFSRSRSSARRAFVAFSCSLAPLGLAAWIAFSLGFVFANFSYVWPTLSDPMGWGWNLLGTAGLGWTPYLTGVVPTLQAAALIGGLAWSSVTAQRAAREPGVGLTAWPVVGFCLACTLGLLWLLVG